MKRLPIDLTPLGDVIFIYGSGIESGTIIDRMLMLPTHTYTVEGPLVVLGGPKNTLSAVVKSANSPVDGAKHVVCMDPVPIEGLPFIKTSYMGMYPTGVVIVGTTNKIDFKEEFPTADRVMCITPEDVCGLHPVQKLLCEGDWKVIRELERRFMFDSPSFSRRELLRELV